MFKLAQWENLFEIFFKEAEKYTKNPVLVVLAAVILFVVTVAAAVAMAAYHYTPVAYAFVKEEAIKIYNEFQKQLGNPSSDL